MSALNGNGQVPVEPTTDREWLEEAERIVAKRTMKLPTRAHLVAALASRDQAFSGMAELASIVALQNRALIALLLSVKQSAFVTPEKAVLAIERRGLDLAVHRNTEDGSIVVRLVQPVAEPATQ